MAQAIMNLNARIRSNKVLDYICSTHFWGPVSNFGIPVAAVMDTQKDPEIISGGMTGALVVYSAVFMRYSLAVTPANYLLFGCHLTNECAQLTQGYRWMQYHKWGGKETALQAKASNAKATIGDLADKTANKAKDAAEKIRGSAGTN